MAHTCIEHHHEQAEGLCRKCGAEYCADCLVYPFGPAQPPFCIPCAVSASGVRANAANPTRVVPKETKRRLKEWRKARKRDLESPPPDGVATWQRMDEMATEDEEVAVAARAAAEREALRLPPPVPETPTPPPGINLAPPGPPGEDWRNDLNPHSEDVPLLGFLDDDEPPAPLLDPMLEPLDQVDLPHADSGFGLGGEPAFDPRNLPVEEPTPLSVPDPELALADFPAPTPYAIDRPAYEPAPFPAAFEPTPPPMPAYEPTAATEPVPAYQPTPFAPNPVFEPSAADEGPVAFEPLGEAFGLAPPAFGSDDQPPLPPATSLADLGLGNPTFASTPAPFADDPLPPPPAPPPTGAPFEPAIPQRVVDATPAAQAAAAAAPPEPPMPPPLGSSHAGTPPAAIRPRTPTRIPAAKPAEKEGDAKAMLARIAALRTDKD